MLEYFETGAFNELIRFSFDEVRTAFNLNIYFVLDEQGDQFVHDATQVKDWYTKELNKIEEYALGEFTAKINSGDEVPEFEKACMNLRDTDGLFLMRKFSVSC